MVKFRNAFFLMDKVGIRKNCKCHSIVICCCIPSPPPNISIIFFSTYCFYQDRKFIFSCNVDVSIEFVSYNFLSFRIEKILHIIFRISINYKGDSSLKSFFPVEFSPKLIDIC